MIVTVHHFFEGTVIVRILQHFLELNFHKNNRKIQNKSHRILYGLQLNVSHMQYTLSLYPYLFCVNQRIWYFINHLAGRVSISPSLSLSLSLSKLCVSNVFCLFIASQPFSTKSKTIQNYITLLSFSFFFQLFT